VTLRDVGYILRAEGVAGVRGDCRKCPIAVLVSRRLGQPVTVECGYITACVRPRPIGDPGDPAHGEDCTHAGDCAAVYEGRAVAHWLGDFDAGYAEWDDLAVVTR
jgi:hypothetical protein